MVSVLCNATLADRPRFCAATALNAERPSESEAYHTAHCAPWASVDLLRHFRVLVLNAGAHRVPQHVYARQMRELGGIVRAYRRARRVQHDSSRGGAKDTGIGGGAAFDPRDSATAVFRATVPGFSGCNETRTAQRFGSVSQAESYYASHPFYSQHEFVPVANRIAAAEVRRAGGLMLDVYPASILRLDDRSGASTSQGGVDCLHYRSPLLNTSLQTWALMLGQLLSTKTSSRPNSIL